MINLQAMIDFNPLIQEIKDPAIKRNVKLFIKRDDLMHDFISGNKWWKLKYNILKAQAGGHKTILTFGGAFSNHIAASAAAGKLSNMDTIGIIRGERPEHSNATLEWAQNNGMQLHFISREKYREKESLAFIDRLRNEFGDFYLIPEGGANIEGVKGCSEILSEVNLDYNYICCPCGTGTTMAGLILSKNPGVKALGFSALKGGDFLKENVRGFLKSFKKELPGEKPDENWDIISDYHFGGYAKVKPELMEFITNFQSRTGIPLDYVYTGKMMYGIYDMISRDFFKSGDTILILHTGGLQGNQYIINS